MKFLIIAVSLIFAFNLHASEEIDCSSDHVLEQSFTNPQVKLPAEIVVYTDFDCGYCRKGSQVVNQLKGKYGEDLKVKVVAFPMNSSKEGLTSAKYYEAVRLLQPSKANDYYIEIYKNGARTDKELTRLALKLGLNKAELLTAVKSTRVSHAIRDNKNEASRLSIKAVPTFVINNRHYITGAYDLNYFEKMFDI